MALISVVGTQRLATPCPSAAEDTSAATDEDSTSPQTVSPL
jgi:hypothetical protein